MNVYYQLSRSLNLLLWRHDGPVIYLSNDSYSFFTRSGQRSTLCERKQFSFALMERMCRWMNNYVFMAVHEYKKTHLLIWGNSSSHSEESLTRHDGLLALMAFGGVLIRIALGAQQLLVFGGERLVHQWALALEAVETVLVPVTVLVGQILKQQNTYFDDNSGWLRDWKVPMDLLKSIWWPYDALSRSASSNLIGRFYATSYSMVFEVMLPCCCSRWVSCTPRRCWSTGSRSTSHSKGFPHEEHTSSQTETPYSSGSHSALSSLLLPFSPVMRVWVWGDVWKC